MLVKERMKALGDHAKSSRQPPVKERKYAKADESATQSDAVDETILENDAAHDSAVAVLADDVTPQMAAHESANDGAVAEITPSEQADEIAAAPSVSVQVEPQPAAAEDGTTPAKAVQEEGTNAAKRAIIHEWENWSALHSDELNDPNVAEYFFRHLQGKKRHLLNFADQNGKEYDVVFRYIIGQ